LVQWDARVIASGAAKFPVMRRRGMRAAQTIDGEQSYPNPLSKIMSQSNIRRSGSEVGDKLLTTEFTHAVTGGPYIAMMMG
jgi:hypothetical protein